MGRRQPQPRCVLYRLNRCQNGIATHRVQTKRRLWGFRGKANGIPG